MSSHARLEPEGGDEMTESQQTSPEITTVSDHRETPETPRGSQHDTGLTLNVSFQKSSTGSCNDL